MAKFDRPSDPGGYVKGLLAAESKGFAAGQDAAFREADNPYQRFEHRVSWLDGFRRARAKEARDGA